MSDNDARRGPQRDQDDRRPDPDQLALFPERRAVDSPSGVIHSHWSSAPAGRSAATR